MLVLKFFAVNSSSVDIFPGLSYKWSITTSPSINAIIVFFRLLCSRLFFDWRLFYSLIYAYWFHYFPHLLINLNWINLWSEIYGDVFKLMTNRSRNDHLRNRLLKGSVLCGFKWLALWIYDFTRRLESRWYRCWKIWWFYYFSSI